MSNAPCPFCWAHLTDRNEQGFYYHPENECWLAGFEFDDDGSIQKWNVRVAPAALVASDGALGDGAAQDELLQLDVLLANLHAAVWYAADAGHIAFDLAGKDEAKAIQRHVRTMLAERAAVSPATADERAELVEDLRAEQQHIAAERDMCDPNDELPRWDALQRVIDYLERASHAAAPADTIERYQAVCSAAYQLAGVVGAPLRFLDALSDAANGEPMSTDDALNLLPVGLDEFDEINRSAAAPADALPDGWKAVPIEPIDAMLEEITLVDGFTRQALIARYQAMLAAAPNLPNEREGK